MRYFKLMLVLVLAALPAAAAARDAGADKSFLEDQIESLLSGAGRAVTITGFRGALSSRATLERMTIADDKGVWLTVEDAVLDWSRAALLRGRLEVAELTAGTIRLARLPQRRAPITPADAEAHPFALPELPVSVSLGKLRADTVHLGAPVLGEAAVLSVDSSLTLADGAGAVRLAIRRAGRNDRLSVDAGYDNATRVLRLELDFDEAEGGLVARRLGVPGAPALRLTVAGNAPLDDFVAQLALGSDGAERLGGEVTIAALAQTGETGETGHRFAADLAGDLRPLVAADLHPFFGASATLALAGQALDDGRLRLDRLRLASGGLRVTGTLALAADGWPDRFRLTGKLGGAGRLRLPLAGPATWLDNARIAARYDATEGEAWQADIAVAGLQRGGLRIGVARIGGEGTITRARPNRLSADMVFGAQGVSHADPALARALGAAPQGALSLRWQPGAPLGIERLTLTSGDASLTASGEIGHLGEGITLAGRAVLNASDLTRFAALAGRDIAGAANVRLTGRGSLLGGDFDIDLAAETHDPRTGTARLDPLLAGRGSVDLAARRGADGITVKRLEIRTPALSADASGRLNGQSGALTLTAALRDLALAEPRLSGPAKIDTALAWRAGGELNVSRLALDAAGARLVAEGTVDTGAPSLPATGRLHLEASDLSRLAALAGRPLAGATDLRLEGTGEIAGRRFDAEVALAAERLRTGIARLDRLTGGRVDLAGRLGWGDGLPFVERLTLGAARLALTAAAPAPGEPLALTLKLADLGDLAPGINGAAVLDGTLAFRDATGAALSVDLSFAGPGGTAARIGGRIEAWGRVLALSVTGQAPLALANGLIAPRSVQGPARFDLRLDGPPSLAALSGEVAVTGARLSVPGSALAIGNLTGTARLGGGQAQVDIAGDAGRGGRFRATGPVGLAPPFAATLEATLDRLGMADPALFRTALDGRLTITGPLAGGARIAGALRLGPTELSVPSGTGASTGALPPITHVGATAAVAATRRRAGLTGAGHSRPAAAFPLDILIDAPGRIFVRGRGIDAELGGQLRLGGTTADVTASGVFELIRGRIDILTRRLDLTEGLIDLRGALDPWLRFVARTETDDLTVDIVLEGLASNPDIRFSSVPDLPQEEILARLLFGRGFGKMSPFQAAQMIGAVATLSGKGAGGLTGRMRGALGLSNFDVTSTGEGATKLSAGAYISDKLYTEVSADSKGKNEIDINLDLSRSITVKGRANNAGETGLGIFFERDY